MAEDSPHNATAPSLEDVKYVSASGGSSGGESDAGASGGAEMVGPESLSVSGGGLMLKPRPFSLTMPPPDDYFFVREGQLEALTKGDKDYSLEISLASAGGAIGFGQNFFTIIGNMISGKDHNNIDLMLAFLALGLIVLAGTKFIESCRTSSNVGDLKKAIKSGQKFKVEE